MTPLDHFRACHPASEALIDGTRWPSIDCGTGDRTIVLLPGGFGTYDSLFPLINRLQESTRVIAVSLPGGLEPLSAFHHALDTILDTARVPSFHLAGQSFGGWLAQQYAAGHGARVLSLTLLHSFAVEPREQRRLQRAAPLARSILRGTPRSLLNALLRSRVKRLLITPLDRARHPDVTSWNQLLAESLANGALHAMATSQAALLAQASPDTFAGPILIIESDNDPAVPARRRAALVRRYPQAHVVTLSGTGHASAIVATDEVVRHMDSFFERFEKRPD